MSGRMGGGSGGGGGIGGSPQMDFSRPGASRQPNPPGSPRRLPPAAGSSRTGAASLTGVREEGPEPVVIRSPGHTSLPPITTNVPVFRQESLDSAYSDVDSNLSVPQRAKSASATSPSSMNAERGPSIIKPPSSQPSLSRTPAPIVYPALLSRVAVALRERLILGDKQKDGLTYPNAFSGNEAVDLIAYVIKTSDRNLALLLGRALDAQRWFHDVTYVHR